MTLIQSSPEMRELDLDTFRLALKDLEDDEEGMTLPDTHSHVTETTLAGLTYARIIEILDPYTVEFEDGQYTVNCVGANHNLSDVKVANQVSLVVNNAAGLIVSGSGITEQDKDDIADKVLDEALDDHVTAGSLSEAISNIGKLTGYKVVRSGDTITIYESDGETIWRQYRVSGGGRVEV